MISCILVIVSKKHQNAPESSAIEEAEKMGVRLMNEEEYRYLKTSSWVVTPERIRCLGGAIFCEHRYNEVFTFYNGADSHYSSRGFRCIAEL